MKLEVFHGSSKFDRRDGYTGGKPGRQMMGFGLYCTNSYRWAELYGRRTYMLTLDLNPEQAAHNVNIPAIHFLEWIRVNCTKKFFDLCWKEWQFRDELNVERVELFMINNIRSVTKLAKPFAEFVAAWDCTHAVEVGGEYGGRCVRLYDFSVICDAEPTKYFDDTIFPRELERHYHF